MSELSSGREPNMGTPGKVKSETAFERLRRFEREKTMRQPTPYALEPWHAEGARILALQGEPIADAYASDTYLPHEEVVAQADANARRIVACVNALEGVETEVLETNAKEHTQQILLGSHSMDDATYLHRAANAYPKLVAHLQALEAHLKGGAQPAEGKALREQQQALLRELGEVA